MNKQDITAILQAVEWNGAKMGQGNGPMSSGPGPLFAACPYCGGLKEPNGHFLASAVGHRPTCIIAQAVG